jgi:hypothetical protein
VCGDQGIELSQLHGTIVANTYAYRQGWGTVCGQLRCQAAYPLLANHLKAAKQRVWDKGRAQPAMNFR